MPPTNYYKVLGICCFIKDNLLQTSDPGVDEGIRDRHLHRYIEQINTNQFTYDSYLNPIEGVDPREYYARRLLIQFSGCIDHTCFDIHQCLETGIIWIDITYSINNNPSYWRFFDNSGPILEEVEIPYSYTIRKENELREIQICSSDFKMKGK